ncbi:MAG: UDP-N-acetylmuramate--L-alanine ligase, partial [Proteobacteria bacterium]|nr:UDP-N-acetylmuramate--L-alanine ligase [Pseudomonadota bacterium]
IHFVGIGGIGMSGIAELLLNLGYRVSGSDLRDTGITRRLARLGGIIRQGHLPENIRDADVVVVSSAVKRDNPEVAAALEASVPIIPRAEMLAELMRLKYSVAVAGAHGKTTTTNMVAAVLAGGGLDPTVVIGGKLKSMGTNARLGKGDFLVAEADESDGSFLKMSPSICVVTNIDLEHLDHYKDLADIQSAFSRFVDRVPFYGLSILCLDSPAVAEVIPSVRKRYVTYGLAAQADVRGADVTMEGFKAGFTVIRRGETLGRVLLNLPGRHNVRNALAAVAVGLELGVSFEHIRAALVNLEGVHRRMEIKGERDGVTVVDDYGHHPTEIAATLAAIRECYPGNRLYVVFEPHRYSRTAALFEEFSRSFYQADRVLILPVYPAGEAPIPGVDALSLAEAIRSRGHKGAAHAKDEDEALARVKRELSPGTVFLTLGAGNVFRLGERFLGTGEDD